MLWNRKCFLLRVPDQKSVLVVCEGGAGTCRLGGDILPGGRFFLSPPLWQISRYAPAVVSDFILTAISLLLCRIPVVAATRTPSGQLEMEGTGRL